LTDLTELKHFLEEQVQRYNHPGFIEWDPVAVPHDFTKKEDIEIAAFFAATLAWGNRKMILKNARALMDCMDRQPFEFVTQASTMDYKPLSKFVHRTFNGEDAIQFVKSLRHIYQNHGGLEQSFACNNKLSMLEGIQAFRSKFFEKKHLSRTTKHVSDPSAGSAAKRLHMFLRWMVRNDNRGVDFGLWNSIQPAQLSIPLDIHSGRIARELGLLKRAQNDAKAVEELDLQLRALDPLDPVKYDFALFGLGVNNDWQFYKK
jgi:uncharacterized protein (TIGR02757 family)